MEEVLLGRLDKITREIKNLSEGTQRLQINQEVNEGSLKEAKITSARLQALLNRFNADLNQYFTLTTEPDADQISEFTTVQLIAEGNLAELKVLLDQGLTPHMAKSKESNSRLPKLDLPLFDGNTLNWFQFWDQFKSSIDERDLNEVDKLLYLKLSLTGEAKDVLEGLHATNKNYKIAVDTLKERYGRESQVIDAHYAALYKVKPARTTSECRKTLDQIEKHLRVLKSLGENDELYHLRFLIMEKFPEEVLYELRIRANLDSVAAIRKTLATIISAREEANRTTQSKENGDTTHYTTEALLSRTTSWDQTSVNRKPPQKRKLDARNTNDPQVPAKSIRRGCAFCEGDHYNDQCDQYATLEERKSRLRGQCFLCFSPTHHVEKCRDKRPCWHCKTIGKHNRALCPTVFSKTQSHTLQVSDPSCTILQTAVARVAGESGVRSSWCRIIFDSGSQRSYITQKKAKELELPTEEEQQLTVFTFGSKLPQEINSPLVSFKMHVLRGVPKVLSANVVPTITQGVPYPKDELKLLKGLEKITLADDGSLSDRVDILIGNDYYHSLISSYKRRISEHLFLIRSEVGYILSGKLSNHENYDPLTVVTYFQSSGEVKLSPPDLPLDCSDLKSLWDLESIGIIDSPKANRDEDAIRQFNETTKYANQRYSVCWPWNEYPPDLVSNFGLAFGRLVSLIKRMDPETLSAYEQILRGQLEKGVIELVPITDQAKRPVHYLPHHGITSPGKAIRIVYDASARIGANKSLNQCLYCGPQMLEDLTSLIIRFRCHLIGILADVEKAFLQLALQEKDRDVTRFLWLKDPSKAATEENLLYLRFARVPFGIISSPFLLNASIKHHLQRSTDNTIQQIQNDIYVDNLVTGTNTPLAAKDLYSKTKATFQQISMNLRDWSSNSREFMEQVNDACPDQIVKLLGLNWCLTDDTLHLRSKIVEAPITKRGILKSLASIYDPCGFVVPWLIPAKILIQDLWKLKIKWDVPLSKEMTEKWMEIRRDLEDTLGVSIPRCYNQEMSIHACQLHCFTDASTKAFAASVYLVAGNKVSFVIGKSRLAPIKDQDSLKIPRLELLGVLIGSRLIQYVVQSLKIKVTQQILWTDSQIVIDWCNSDKLLTPFVSRRVEEIKRNKDLIIRYVPSELNPADVSTRPNSSNAERKGWLVGPDFLKKDPRTWPTRIPRSASFFVGESLTNSNPDETNEQRNGSELNQEVTHTDGNYVDNQEKGEQNEITVMDNTLDTIKLIQAEYYPQEIQGKETNLSRNLKLFKDIDGLLRCKGRFKYAGWTFDKRYPVLLPKDSEFTNSIIKETHEKNYHVGANHTLSLIRQSYWIPQGKNQVQKILRKCSRCIKYGGGPFKLPATPALPPERVNFSMPFTFTGIDYLGPVLVKTANGTNKRWICLFTCLAVRAIHLEVVENLTADEGLLALRRMISTRRVPTLIMSDNAQTFKMMADIVSNSYCVENKIQWRFIPELAPWHGGFYERMVGMVKYCLQRTLQKHLLRDTQLTTIMKEIEAVLNTRPLLSVDSELDQVLSPSNFLNFSSCITMETSTSQPLMQGTIVKQDLINSWKRARIILDEFKEMFENQYLPSLRERYRHSHKEPRVTSQLTPKEGQIVQIKGHKNREGWKVGRIVALVKGRDDMCRVAKVKVGDTVFTRSLTHLYPLEMEDTNLEDGSSNIKNNIHTQPKEIMPNDIVDISVPTETDLVEQPETIDSIQRGSVSDLKENVEKELEYMEVISDSTEEVTTTENEQMNTNEYQTDTIPPGTTDVRPPRRRAAIQALEKIRQWTHNLAAILLDPLRGGSVVATHEC